MMALSFEHGAIQWLAADAGGSTYTVSGLSFQPKALRFYWLGLASATDTASQSTNLKRGIGFAASTSDRRCVAALEQDAELAMVCVSGYRDDAVVATLNNTPGFNGLLDLTAIASDGFTLTVDAQINANLTVFWEAWGGSDITVVATGAIAEPAATGNQDYTVTGFTLGASNQVVMFAGVQSTAAANSAERNDSGLHVGFASSTNTANNITLLGNQDDGSANADTDGYCQTGECLSMIAVAGGNATARATLTAWGTDNFRLNWLARAATSRRSIFLAIKGGGWTAASTSMNCSTNGNTGTISGLSYAPVGVCLLSRRADETAAGTSDVEDRLMLGTATGTSSRRAMGSLSENGTAAAEVDLVIEYDQCLADPTTGGALNQALDINAWNSDGFQLIVDAAGSGTTGQFIGYLTFGNEPQGHPAVKRMGGVEFAHRLGRGVW